MRFPYKLLYLGLVYLLSIQYTLAQTYNLGTTPATNNATINTCGGTFYDSGGSGGSYGNNQNTTVTFCSNNSKQMVMNFSSFNLEGGNCANDYLRIYDGATTSATLIGTYCGSNSPGIITASGTCLTVQFVSNGGTVNNGWEAALSCYECIDNSTCATQYIDLDFSDNTITKTADPTGWIGDEWRFDNVYTNTYAKVKIVATQNTVTQAVSNIDNPTQPNAQTWSPELGFNVVQGQDSYIDWEITFYDNTTNQVKPLPKASRVTSYDVDGPNNRNPYAELHGHTGPDGFIVGSTSQLSILNEPPRTIVLGTPQEYDGISNNDFSKVTFYYSDSITIFQIRLGIRAVANAGSVPSRQYALGFLACPNFSNPVVNPIIPTITGINSLCVNGNLTQTYSVPNNFSNIVWSTSGGTIISGQGTQTVTVSWPATVGNYKVSVVTTDGSSCVVNNSRSVTVNPVPTASASGSTVCTGETITLTSSGGTIYSWSGPSGFTSTSQNPTRANATLAMSGTYTVTVTDANGCTGTATATVVVNTTPSVSLTTGTATICRGTTSASIAYSSPSGSPTTYSIDFNAAANTAGLGDVPPGTALPASPININIPTGIAPGTYTGSLSVANASCSNSTPQTITIVVNNPAVVDAGPDLTVCANAASVQVTLSSASVGGGSTTAAWSIISGGGSLSSTAQTSTPSNIIYTSPAYIPANGNYSSDTVLRLSSSDPDGSGPCPIVTDDRIVSINYITGGMISNSQTICIDGAPQPIGGN